MCSVRQPQAPIFIYQCSKVTDEHRERAKLHVTECLLESGFSIRTAHKCVFIMLSRTRRVYDNHDGFDRGSTAIRSEGPTQERDQRDFINVCANSP